MLGVLLDLGLKFTRSRPAALEVVDEALGARLAEALGDRELAVSVRPDLPEVTHALREMERGIGGDAPPLSDALDAPGVTVAQMRAFAEAARDFSVRGQISSMLAHEPASEQRKPYPEQDNEVPFTVGVIVLSAKMAKADGIVAADEVKAFKEAFKVSPAEMKHAAPVFNSAKRDSANFETCAEQLVTVFKGNRKLLEDVLDGLFHIAKADAEVHRQEEQFLAGVAKRFGLTPSEFNSIKARHMVADKRNPFSGKASRGRDGERKHAASGFDLQFAQDRM